MHVRVHRDYVQYLATTAPPPGFVPARRPWSVLDVARSPWYDFLKAHDRAHALRAVWAVLSFLMRDADKDA